MEAKQINLSIQKTLIDHRPPGSEAVSACHAMKHTSTAVTRFTLNGQWYTDIGVLLPLSMVVVMVVIVGRERRRTLRQLVVGAIATVQTVVTL